MSSISRGKYRFSAVTRSVSRAARICSSEFSIGLTRERGLGTRLAGLTRSTGRKRPYGSGRLYSPHEKKGLSRSWSVGPRQGNCEHKPCYGKPFINADNVDSRGTGRSAARSAPMTLFSLTRRPCRYHLGKQALALNVSTGTPK